MQERVRPFRQQNYYKLKRNCLKHGVLFEDPLFPPTAESLYYKRTPPSDIEWKRPSEICRDPRLFVDGISSRDLHQGSLGNCWMVAATSCLATEPAVWKKVIPNYREQDWNPKHPEKYAGIFHFRFWRFGFWIDVVIDDRLPTSKGGGLLFCRSNNENEFWCALLEKAYAKLNGCYEALEGGNTAEALVDFTGGISEPVCLDQGKISEGQDERKHLYKNLMKAYSRGALISCSIRPAQGEALESQMGCGLVKGHAYGVTEVRKLRLGTGLLSFFRTSRLYMIRMRNPWGTTEWSGPWSDGSQEWNQVSKHEREKLGVTVSDDGEFWMNFDDFCSYFTDLVICRRINTSLLSFHKTWLEACLFGEWVPGQGLNNRSGGCINHRDTFLQNPQFMFEVVHKEDILFCLQQEDRRAMRKEGIGENLAIGFEVFQVEVNRKYRLHTIPPKAASSVYIDSRSVFLRTELKQGRYIVIPTTFSAGEKTKFLLRMFTETKANFREVTLDQPKPSFWRCCWGSYCRVTSIHLQSAVGLVLRGASKDPDVFAMIKCEGTSVRSTVFKSSSSPDFNLKAIFYRRNPRRPIKIEVYSKGFFRNILLGCVSVEAAVNEMGKSQVLSLQDSKRGSRATGSVLIETSSSDCLTDL
ncbi:calpain-5-like isoform X1 [Erpetoichthys calabaricus]|uniref:calpain-5-like isoform X1 n=1 Tax=Erpetoichthys calabaricus TaxID=27687 RepID=UPI002233E890|nr:calpain-5-like isoform X1 [Erpetoichthys calabaricus]XP_028653784.2 calpain-5-like isoform X1 [Erpetoichthys calabaricus]XP_028653785.2 calpain-5-like isoform X1 [Erpetoichthys calabaricus]